jgi:hypothetical protein
MTSLHENIGAVESEDNIWSLPILKVIRHPMVDSSVASHYNVTVDPHFWGAFMVVYKMAHTIASY